MAETYIVSSICIEMGIEKCDVYIIFEFYLPDRQPDGLLDRWRDRQRDGSVFETIKYWDLIQEYLV
jgi:hypothetical protein